jgi:hypothetical protein
MNRHVLDQIAHANTVLCVQLSSDIGDWSETAVFWSGVFVEQSETAIRTTVVLACIR